MSLFKRSLLASALAFACIYSPANAQDAKRYDGVKLKWLIPSGQNAWIMKVHQQSLKEDLGIEIVGDEVNENELFQKAQSEWMTGGAGYCLVTLLPPWNGDFMAGGYLQPLDKLIAANAEAKAAYDDLLPGFKELATEWNGVPYAFGQDGDAYNLYYRKDILSKPEVQAKFKEKFGYDLPVPPKTIRQLADAAEFFAGFDWVGDGQKRYGYSQVWKIVLWRTFLPMFGSVTGGALAFDNDMKPHINRPEAVELLNDLRRLLNAGPPSARSFSYPEAPAAFINGDVPMTWFWGDVAKLIYTPGWTGDPKNVGPQWKTKIGYGLMPGAEVGGKLYQYNELSGKIIGVPSSCKEPEAAVAALAYISDPKRSYLTVDSSSTGSDTFAVSQATRKATDWKVPIDQEFLDLIPELMKNGYPALYIPGGQEYYDSLDRHISEFLVNPNSDAAEALAAVEADWQGITDSRGRDKQIEVWRAFQASMAKVGFQVKQ